MPSVNSPYDLFSLHLEQHNFRQTCEISTAAYYDENGQPVQEDRRTVRCRIEYVTERTADNNGDIVSVRAVRILLPGDDPVQAEDKVYLPIEFQGYGPIISRVENTTDNWGRKGHKAVTIL